MLRGKYIALYAYINKGKLEIIDLGNYLKNLEELLQIKFEEIRGRK